MAKNITYLIKQLEVEGYKVKKTVPTTKKTFEVEVALIEEFMNIVDKRGLKVKDAIDEALKNWIKKR
jgi:hypothetical protein